MAKAPRKGRPPVKPVPQPTPAPTPTPTPTKPPPRPSPNPTQPRPDLASQISGVQVISGNDDPVAIGLDLALPEIMLQASRSRMMRADIALAWVAWSANYVTRAVQRIATKPVGVVQGPSADELVDALGADVAQLARELNLIRLHYQPQGVSAGPNAGKQWPRTRIQPAPENHFAFARPFHLLPHQFRRAGPFKAPFK